MNTNFHNASSDLPAIGETVAVGQLAPRFAGIVLCGGKSSRMGTSKAMLPVGSQTMLQRTVQALLQVVSPVIVVAAEGQELPPLPSEVTIVYDEVEHRGPLGGLAAGFAGIRHLALPQPVTAAYVSSCDVPLLSPAFVRQMTAELGEFDVAVPSEQQFHHPLAAVYRIRLEPIVRELISADQLRPMFVFQRCYTNFVPVDRLRSVDPELDSLRNVNTVDEYTAILTLEKMRRTGRPQRTATSE